MNSELFLKISQGEERVERIKAFLVFPVAAFQLAIMSGGVRTDKLMPDTQLCGGFLKKGLYIPFAVRKAVCKFKAVVGLDTFHTNTSVVIPFHQSLQKIGRGVGGLFWVGGQKAESGELINGGILEQAQFRVSDAAARDDLHIHLNLFSRMSHLLVMFWRISLFLLLLWEHPQLAHNPKQAFGSAGIATLFQAVPQLHQAELWITTAHIPNQLQFRFGMLVWMSVRPPGLTGQRFHVPIPASPPEVDIGSAPVVLPASTAYTVFLCILH